MPTSASRREQLHRRVHQIRLVPLRRSGLALPEGSSSVHTQSVLALESNFLVPNGTFIVELVFFVLFVAIFGLLVLWPLVETIVWQQWGYMLGVVLLGPIGGSIWFFVGRHQRSRRRDRARGSAGQPSRFN